MARYWDSAAKLFVWGDDRLKDHLRGGYVIVQPDNGEPSYYAHKDQLTRAPIQK